MQTLERNISRCRIYWLDGEKMKTNLIVLYFDLPLKRETATKTALLAEVLKQGCASYSTQRQLAQKAENLYGAIWDINVVKKGDRQLLVCSLEVPKLVPLEEGLDFIRELLLNPKIEMGGFPKETVERQKDVLTKRIQAQKDDKRAYARKRCLEETAKGTPFAISGDGYAEDIPNITPMNLYEYYLKLIQDASVKVVFCGEEADKQTIAKCRKWFPGGQAETVMLENSYQFPKEPVFVKETMDVTQSRMLMAFDTGVRGAGRHYAEALTLNQLLGGGPDSALFREIREKQGLCYDVKSYYYFPAGLLFVQMGIKKKDAKQASKSVVKELGKIEDELISGAELGHSKKMLIDEYALLADQPWALADYFTEQILAGNTRSLNHLQEKIDLVRVEDIAKVAGNLELKAVYLLSGEEA